MTIDGELTIEIKISDIKERIEAMQPNLDMQNLHFAYFEGYVNALKWVLMLDK